MKQLFILTLFLPTLCWAQTNLQQQTPRPFILGTIHEIQSNVLKEKRTLNIYLPPGYDHKHTATYPVIYLLDGSAEEDFIHVTGLVQFCSFEWVNIIPPSIVVGIANIDRKRDFTFPTTITMEKKTFPTSGRSAILIDFIEQELQPYINQTFKTNRTNTLIGQSLGGLLATEILLHRTHLFSKYIIISPGLWWNNGSLLENMPALKHSASVYIAVGKEGLAPSATPHVMEVDANVLAEKLKQQKILRVFFDYLPQHNHANILHQALLNAFKQQQTL